MVILIELQAGYIKYCCFLCDVKGITSPETPTAKGNTDFKVNNLTPEMKNFAIFAFYKDKQSFSEISETFRTYDAFV